jgi:NitT/TauT family transport system permease protein
MADLPKKTPMPGVAAPAEEPAIEEIGPPPRQTRYHLLRIASFLVVMVAWELLGRQVAPLFMSYPSAIIRSAVEMSADGELAGAFFESLKTLLLGFGISAVLGIAWGVAIGRYRAIEAVSDWLVNALYATPLVAIIPLVILWFGLGFSAKLFIVIILAIFPILINTASGVRNVSESLIDVGTAFAATEREIFVKIIFPAALPYMMTGLRLGIGRAIIAMVVAEFFTAITGLGALIVKYGDQYDTASMFVPILVLMALGIILTAIVRRAEAWIAPWKEAGDE